MGNSESTIQKKARDIEGAVQALNRVNDALADYRSSVYKSEFGKNLPQPNDPDLMMSKRYSNMSYQKNLNTEGIKSMVGSVIEIPTELEGFRQTIITQVVALAELTVGGAESLALSKAYCFRLTGNDGKQYLYAALIAATAIEAEKYGMDEGVSCQAAMTYVFRADGTSNSIPRACAHEPEEPAVQTPMRELMPDAHEQ